MSRFLRGHRHAGEPMTEQSAQQDVTGSHRPGFRLAWLAPRHWASWSSFVGAAIIAPLPAAVRGWMADRLAHIWYRFDSRRRRRIMTNLRLCFPSLDDQGLDALLRAHARVAAHMILGYSRLMFRSPAWLRSDCDIVGDVHLERAAARGRNVILLTPHWLSLEYAGIRLNLDRPLMTMIRTHEDPVADWIVTRMRTRFGAVLMPHDAGMLALVRALRRGLLFYYLPDEDQGLPGMVFADFFGVPKASVPVLGRLARSANADVIPMRSAYDPGQRRFTIEFYAPVEGLGGSAPEQDAAVMNAVIERMIRSDPAQYQWSQKVFRTRPPGEPSFYE
jgi:Kdo2-lipid IVA lauroyltransferase/acyltransferase